MLSITVHFRHLFLAFLLTRIYRGFFGPQTNNFFYERGLGRRLKHTSLVRCSIISLCVFVPWEVVWPLVAIFIRHCALWRPLLLLVLLSMHPLFAPPSLPRFHSYPRSSILYLHLREGSFAAFFAFHGRVTESIACPFLGHLYLFTP